MSETASELIQAFYSLSPTERHSVLIELTRVFESDAGSLTDEELVVAGEQVFAMYDKEEAEHGEASEG